MIKLVHNGRDQKILFDQVGCYANIFPMRLDLSGDPTFTTLLNQVRNSWLQYISCTPCYPVELLDEENILTSPYINYIDSSTQYQLGEGLSDINQSFRREEPLDTQSRRRLLEGEGVTSFFYKMDKSLRVVVNFPKRFYRMDTVEKYLDYICSLIDLAIDSPECKLSELFSKIPDSRKPDQGYFGFGNESGSASNLSRNFLPW